MEGTESINISDILDSSSSRSSAISFFAYDKYSSSFPHEKANDANSSVRSWLNLSAAIITPLYASVDKSSVSITILIVEDELMISILIRQNSLNEYDLQLILFLTVRNVIFPIPGSKRIADSGFQ